MPEYPAIHVISLREENARRERMSEQFDRLGISFSFFDACNGRDGYAGHFSGVDNDKYLLAARRLPTAGEIGCFASHRALWKHCADTGKPIAIVEDDALLEPEFPAAVQTAASLIETCGYIRLERNKSPALPFLPARDEALGETGSFTLHYLYRTALCLTAYMISPQAAEKLLRHSEVLVAPADRFVQQIWLHRQPLFMLSPAVARQSGFESSLETGRRSNTQNTPAKALLAVRRLLAKTVQTCQRWWFNRTTGKTARQTANEQLVR